MVSRSSGLCFRLSIAQLWMLPILQAGFLTFFVTDGLLQFVDSEMLFYLLAVIVGLIGGTVYIQAYLIVSETVKPDLREFSLAAISVADTLGILCANVFGLTIQECLYKYNNISDSASSTTYKCPLHLT